MSNGNIRVLVVDPDERDYATTRTCLDQAEPSRYEVEWVSTFEAGLREITGGEYDVCLVELGLGPRSGIDLVREVRSQGCEAPVILLSDASEPGPDVDPSQAGANDHLTKDQLVPPLLTRSIRYSVEHQRVLRDLRDTHQRYSLAVQGARDGLWEWNLDRQRAYFSPRWTAMLGLRDDEVGSSPREWLDRIHPEDVQRVRAALDAHLQGDSSYFECEHRIRQPDGSYRWMLARGLAQRNDAGAAQRIAGSLSDITDHRVAQEQLAHEAMHDALTGLPNRALFTDRLAQALARASRCRDYSFAVLYADLDRFKVVNDSLGHALGDRLLVAAARRVQSCLRPGDTVARLGGDEFTVLLDGVQSPSDATRVSERIQRQLAAPFMLDGNELFTSTSIGIALSNGAYQRPEDLLRDADTAVHRAKALGRARHVVFDSRMHARAVNQLRLETDLWRAVERREFILYFQPIVSLDSGRITGLESLIRWQHPERGLLAPGEFIPLAEETGQIVPIGRWVLRESCRAMGELRRLLSPELEVSISVNLSTKQFAQPDLVEDIERVLRDNDLDGSCLRLEITEGIVMENADASAVLLERLQDLRVQVHIDDFGVGYSSLAYLHRFPIDALKIDRSFVGRLEQRDDSAKIVQTILALAANLGKGVIAEGVENAQQLALLRRLGCPRGQGFFFARPLPFDELVALLESRPTW